jgi:hypothetical protein
MNDVFTMPQNISTVGDYFALGIFTGCAGAAFTMNAVFNLPQNISTVGLSFASSMFSGCSGAAFRVNSGFAFPRLSQAELDKLDVFSHTFYRVTAGQTRTAASIINGNPDPSADKNTFGPGGAWTAYGSIPANWK